MFTDIIPTLRTVGDSVSNNLNDASHLPHLAESFFILCCTSCELTEGSSRRKYTFTSSIRRAPSRPGIVRTRNVPKVGKCVKFRQITTIYFSQAIKQSSKQFSRDNRILYLIVRVLGMFSEMLHLPSFKNFTSSKICTATCP